MAATKSRISTLFTSASVAAGLTKATAATGTAYDASTVYGGELVWSFTNGSSAPGAAPTATFQVSAATTGQPWFDLFTAYGDTVASSVNTGAIPLDLGVMAVRVLVYGHTTNAITFAAEIHAVTGV